MTGVLKEKDLNLASFMDEGIRGIAADALKMAARRPALIFEFKRLAAALKGQERRRAEEAEGGLRVPPFMIASITRRCNLGCAGCYAAVNMKGCSEELPADAWGRLFAEAEDLGVSFVLLAGGEPLERMDVLSEAAKHRSVVFPVFTNGCALDGDRARFFASNRNLVPIISIEGGRELTDARRGPGVYDRIMSAMKSLSERAAFFGASITATKENIAEACSDDFIGMLRKRGASAFIYVEYVPADGVSADLAPGPAEREYLAARVAELKRLKGGIHICFPGDEEAMGGCLAAGRGFVHINSAGGVEPCPFSPVSDRNISKVGLREALASPFLAALRESGEMELGHLGGCALWDKLEKVQALLSR